MDVIVIGLLLGGTYALMAMGLQLQYGVARIMNLASGETLVSGAFAAVWFFTAYKLSPLWALIGVVPAAFAANWAIYRFMMLPLVFLPLLIITILVLVVTIIGIPLLALIPFILLGLAVIALVGFTAVAQQLGAHVGRRLGWSSPSVYMTTFAGVVAILLPVLLARLALLAGGTGVALLWHGLAMAGFFVEYLAWTVGFGAVALVRFAKKPAIGQA